MDANTHTTIYAMLFVIVLFGEIFKQILPLITGNRVMVKVKSMHHDAPGRHRVCFGSNLSGNLFFSMKFQMRVQKFIFNDSNYTATNCNNKYVQINPASSKLRVAVEPDFRRNYQALRGMPSFQIKFQWNYPCSFKETKSDTAKGLDCIIRLIFFFCSFSVFLKIIIGCMVLGLIYFSISFG